MNTSIKNALAVVDCHATRLFKAECVVALANSQEYDLVKQGSLNLHQKAIAIVQSVAMLLKYRPIDDWHFEIDYYRKQFLGSSYTPILRHSCFG